MTGSVDNPTGQDVQCIYRPVGPTGLWVTVRNHNGLVMQGNLRLRIIRPASQHSYAFNAWLTTSLDLIISDNNNMFLIIIIYNLNYLFLSNPTSGLFPEPYSYPVYMQHDMIWHAKAGMSRICWSIYRMHMTGQIGTLSNFVQKNTAFQVYFKKTVLFSVWIPISEEGKSNLRKPYLRVLVRIAKSLYSGGSASVSGSAPAYARSGSTSVSASGSESTISPNIYLNWVSVSFYVI
jgi:hypothetical protein